MRLSLPDVRAVVLSALLAAAVLAAPGVAEELDQEGRSHPWKGESGHYRVIDFAASWCGPCWRTLPKLQALADELPELRVVVVSVDDERSGRDRLVEELDLRLPVLWDENYAIAEHYEPEAMPSTFVLDPSGSIIYQQIGSGSEEWAGFESFVRSLPAMARPGARRSSSR